MDAGFETMELYPWPAPPRPREVKALVIKLRWIGMEGEAEQMSHLLGPDEGPLIGPIDTD
jgi:hypothetical protein